MGVEKMGNSEVLGGEGSIVVVVDVVVIFVLRMRGTKLPHGNKLMDVQ